MTQSFKQSMYALLIVIFALLATKTAMGQNSLKLDCSLTKNGELSKSNEFVVKIINGVDEQVEFKANKGFKCDLEYNNYYMLVVYCDGCISKFISIDTSIDEKKKVKFPLSIDLQTSVDNYKMVNVGGIYYNKNIRDFTYFLN